MTQHPTWAQQLHLLDDVVDRLLVKWRPDGPTEDEIQDMNKLAMSILACGYLCHVYTDDKRPVFMPLWNYACNQGVPNPDYVYSKVQVDPAGVYEITGDRGTTRFVEITQQGHEMLGMQIFEERTSPALSVTHDLDELTIGDDRIFSVVISAERPDGYTGDWWQLDERAHGLLMRRCACDWKGEIDARVAISRLDEQGDDMSSEEIARRMSNMARWIEGMIEFDMHLVRYYREHHGFNVLTESEWTKKGGGLAARQAYYDGIYQIADDEALVVEFPVPEDCFYWQILVADDRFSTVDWVNRLSSLNDFQARVDDDGWFRGVVSKRDPGVHNWLDKADFPWGILQARFYRSADSPDISVKKVPVDNVLDHLPGGTPVLTSDERARQLRERRDGAQLRRIW